MKLEIRPSFDRDLGRIRQTDIRRRLTRKLEELESASRIAEVTNVLKMEGSDNLYRIRIGDHRLVIEVEGEVVTLVRFLHRSNVYRELR